MAIFNFNVPFYAYDQWAPGAYTDNTVGYQNGAVLSLNAAATLTIIHVQDDDRIPSGGTGNMFSDGYIDVAANGSASSTENNDQRLSQPVTVNGITYPAGAQVELEFAFSTLGGETLWVIRIGGVNVGISGPGLPVPGQTYTVSGSADAQATPINTVPCFTDGALIATPFGPVAIEDLVAGDLVLTLDHGPQRIVWAGHRCPSALELMMFPMMRAVVITKGAFGPGKPAADLVLSAQHRVMLTSAMAELCFGAAEVLAPAHGLINGRTVHWSEDATALTYRHILLDRHEIVSANGLPVESLYPGSHCLSAQNLLELDLIGATPETGTPLARLTLRKHESRLLAV